MKGFELFAFAGGVGLLVCGTQAFAGEPLSGLSFFSPQNLSFAYSGWIAPGSSESDDTIQSHRLSVQGPLFKGEKDTLSGSIRGGVLHFGNPTNAPYGDLKSLEWGAQFNRKLEGAKFAGGRLSVGSASDKIFAGSDVTTVSAIGFYGFPAKKSEAALDARWILSLFFSNNNPIVNYVPIPGFAYLYRTKSFSGIFGIPFASVQWYPTGAWMYSFSIFGPSLQAELGYGHPRFFQTFVGASWAQQMFLREGRVNTDDRIFFDEKRAFTGARMPLFKSMATELQAGYAFGRQLVERKSLWKPGGTRDAFANSWFAACNLRLDI